jgi:hypothetical protein
MNVINHSDKFILLSFLPLLNSQAYRSSMLKAFKRTLEDGAFSFVIGNDFLIILECRT